MASVADPSNKIANRETGWVNRLFNKETYTPEYQELKFTLHRKLLDRVNLEALSSMAGERVRNEIRAAVAKLVDEIVDESVAEMKKQNVIAGGA